MNKNKSNTQGAFNMNENSGNDYKSSHNLV